MGRFHPAKDDRQSRGIARVFPCSWGAVLLRHAPETMSDQETHGTMVDDLIVGQLLEAAISRQYRMYQSSSCITGD